MHNVSQVISLSTISQLTQLVFTGNQNRTCGYTQNQTVDVQFRQRPHEEVY